MAKLGDNVKRFAMRLEMLEGRPNGVNCLRKIFLAHAHAKGCIDLGRELLQTTNDIHSVQVLLDCGVDVDSRTARGETPLHLASQQGFLELAELLLKHNAKPNARDAVGMSPLHYAAKQGNGLIITLLISYGANVNERSKQDLTPLHFAACGHGSAVQLLLQFGAEPWSSDRKGGIPWQHFVQWYAAQSRRGMLEEENVLSLADAFLSRATDSVHSWLVKKEERVTVLDCAETLGHLSVIQYLVNNDAITQKPVEPVAIRQNGMPSEPMTRWMSYPSYP
jgi:hypothetical protein